MLDRSVMRFWLAFLLVGCGSAPEAAPVVSMGPVSVLIDTGQSNCLGRDTHDAPAGLPDKSIPFFELDLATEEPHGFGPLAVAPSKTFSHEIRIAQRLPGRVAVIKIGQGTTRIASWVPACTTAPASKFYPALREAVAALPYPPGTEYRFLWAWDQGESDAVLGSTYLIESWSDNFSLIKAELETIVGQTLDPYVVRTSSHVPGKTVPGLLESEQASVVSAAHLFDTNDLPLLPDGLHRTGAAENTLGDRIADQILNDYRSDD